MEKLATDIYSFDQLRKNGFTYVDKTAQLLPLADLSIGKQFFLARPRRFGKSLLVSTLQCLFEGRRELFSGLAVEDKWDWSQKWPVLHLDMGSCQASTMEEFGLKLRTMLTAESERLGVALRGEDGPAQLQFLMTDLASRSPDGLMVLLVVEYDQPLLGHLSKADVLLFRDALKSFGVMVDAEVITDDGRIDMTCETPAAIWLVEFKLDRSADEALAQIERNGYAAKFDLSKKRVIKVGVAFSSERRTITDIKTI